MQTLQGGLQTIVEAIRNAPPGAQALTFVQEIGELAEAEGHHPNISFGWGNATVSLQTKKIKGLHENDFIIAAKIDRIFSRSTAA